MSERVIDYLFGGIIVSAVIAVAIVFIVQGNIQRNIDEQLQQQYVQACISNGGIILDSACYDPIKLEEAKLHIPTG